MSENSILPTTASTLESGTPLEQSQDGDSKRTPRSKRSANPLATASTHLTARETMVPSDNREPLIRNLTYTGKDGQAYNANFSETDLERCPLCNRNVPTAHMNEHMGWDHGR